MQEWLWLLGGLALLIGGAHLLVSGASNLALRLRVPSLVVGLTVVAFGTSAPELAVSVRSSLAGQAELALGNVVGSNIFNVLLILGLSALITPLAVHRQLIRLDVPLMMVASVLVLVMALDGRLSRADGAVLAILGLAYTVFLYRQGKRDGASAELEEGPRALFSWPKSLFLVLFGLGLLILGARWLVDAASAIARGFGMSELVIGLTVVAAGTSLPEVATSVLASVRGERDLAVGNVVGSNLFNLLWVLGAASLVSKGGVGVTANVLQFDFLVMIAAAFACLPIFWTGYRIERWEAVLFLLLYGAYVTVLFTSAGQGSAPQFSELTALAFVVPLVALTLLVLVRQRGSRGAQEAQR